jgi:hypothetical protein
MVMSSPLQRLHDEVADHAAVVGVHARAVGVEDARHLDLQRVLAVVIEKQGFGAALAFVVAAADADGVDVAPVGFDLGMHLRVAIDLAGGGLEDLGAQALGQAEHVDGAVHAGLGGLHRVVLVVDGAGRAGQVVDLVHLDIQRKGDVVAHQLEARVVEQVGDVGLVPVKKLSTQSTSWPCSSKRSHRWLPRKPAPPVTRMRCVGL